MEEHRIKSYDEGKQDARQEILNWIEENRTLIGGDEDPWIIRDHFTSENLIAFIKSAK